MKTAILMLALLLGSCVLAATNDVARCWAVTKSGNRCARRAVVGEHYCRQHAADRTPRVQPDRCRSMTTNGVPCVKKPLPGRNYCSRHSLLRQ